MWWLGQKNIKELFLSKEQSAFGVLCFFINKKRKKIFYKKLEEVLNGIINRSTKEIKTTRKKTDM